MRIHWRMIDKKGFRAGDFYIFSEFGTYLP
jgi:hypothetical protein